MKHKFKVLLAGIVILIMSIVPVHAQKFDSSYKGSISLNLIETQSKQSVKGAKFAIYHIANVTENDNGELIYVYTDEYKDCGIKIDELSVFENIENIIKDKPYTSLITTDHNGKASISDLSLGLYFVKQINSVDGFAVCKSFLVTIPIIENKEYIYDIDASPKTELSQYISISIEKQWKTDKKSNIPEQVTVQLYKDNEVIKTAILNKDNNWKVEYKNMLKSDTYTIKEINVPKGYSDVYKQNGYDFTVINVSSLIETGQLIWPIPILSLTGVFFITIGFVVIRKSSKNHG